MDLFQSFIVTATILYRDRYDPPKPGGHIMRRREFIALLAGGAAVAWPFSASPQHSPLPVVGFISIASASGFSHLVAALRRSLSERGYDEGRNYSMEFRWAEGRPERLPAMATELVERGVSLIIATGGSLPANAAKSATTKIPIIFSSGTDPVKAGLVTSFNQPGGNVTGIYIFSSTMEAKRLGLLREIVPKAKTIAVLVNSTYPTVDLQISQVEDGARSLGLQTQIFRTTPGQTFETVFAEIAQSRADALVVCADPYFNSQRAQIVAMAARHAIPAIYEQREFTTAGGLSSYGISITNAYRELGVYAARILKGEKPADLPVLEPTKFEFIINLKTAKALGVTFSDNLISLADEVID